MNEIKKYKKMHDDSYNTEIVDASKIDRKVKQHKVRDKNNNKQTLNNKHYERVSKL